jgi:hypothetical protein
MSNPFAYKAPDANERRKMETLSMVFTQLYDLLLDSAYSSDERTLAVRKLQEARMWANVAILNIGL